MDTIQKSSRCLFWSLIRYSIVIIGENFEIILTLGGDLANHLQ